MRPSASWRVSVYDSVGYHRLIQAGRPAKLALTACMGYLLVILNAMVRDGRP